MKRNKSLRKIRKKRHQFVTNIESSKNRNVKSEINKLSTNNRCQFLENIVPINETEQNPNRLWNIDFLFTLGSNKCSLYLCHHGTLISMNLYLFSKWIPSDFKSLSSVWIDMLSVCYILCNNMHIYISASVIVTASNKELQVCVW